MKYLLLFFRKLIPSNKKSWSVFAFCLLTSAIFWAFLTFNRTYKADVDFKVVYHNFPDDKLLINNPVEELRLKIQAKGFELFRQSAFGDQPTLTLNFKDFKLSKKGSISTYSIGLNASAKEIVGKRKMNFSIVDFSKDTLRLQYDDLHSKMLPVRKLFHINYDSALVAVKVLQSYDSVEVMGSKYFIEQLNFVNTKEQQFRVKQNDTTLTVDLENIKGVVKFEPAVLPIKLDVSPLQNYELRVPVYCIDRATDVDVKLFPSEVSVEFSCTAEQLKFISSKDFGLQVPYNSLLQQKSKANIRLDRFPKEAKNIKISPAKVEYLIRVND